MQAMHAKKMETKLPELPKIRKRKEADITPFVMDWFFNNYPHDVAVEVKIKGGRLKKHQPVALEQVAYGVFKHKLKDFGGRNPFDFIVLKKAHAFIVIADGRHCQAYNYKMEWQFDFQV